MQLTFRSKKTSDFVFTYLSDMNKFTSVHPVIYKIDKIKDNNYLVHETLKFGFIPFSFTYPVTIKTSLSTKTIGFKAVVKKLVRIEMTFVLADDTDYTIISEIVEFKSLLPVKVLMQAIFKKQHQLLFKNIEMQAT